MPTKLRSRLFAGQPEEHHRVVAVPAAAARAEHARAVLSTPGASQGAGPFKAALTLARLARQEESRARQRTLETHVRALPALRDQPVALSSQAFRQARGGERMLPSTPQPNLPATQTFGEFRHDSGAAEKPAGATF